MTLICAVATNPKDGIAAAHRGADAIEFRLDLFCTIPGDFSFFRQRSPTGQPLTTIVTFRGCTEKDSYDRAFAAGASYADIEATSPLRDEYPNHTICSVHNFQTTPSADKILYLMADLAESGIPKGAFAVRTISDLITLSEAATVLRKTNKPFILIGMNRMGQITRIRAEELGSWLNYVSTGGPASFGQLTLTDALSLSPSHPMITGLIGCHDAVFNSKSPQIHAAAFRHTGILGIYLPFATQSTDVSLISRLMNSYDITGLNVTMPYKKAILPYLSKLSSSAEKAGAVNTITKDLTGFNTDIAGVSALFSGYNPAGKSVLILGAGGAARAACVYLKDAGAKIFIANRTYENAVALARFCGGTAVSLQNLTATYDAVVLASPISPIPPQQVLRPQVFAADMNYRSTPFTAVAQTCGCSVADGRSMLTAQAAESFRIWTGTAVDAAVMDDAFGDEI